MAGRQDQNHPKSKSELPGIVVLGVLGARWQLKISLSQQRPVDSVDSVDPQVFCVFMYSSGYPFLYLCGVFRA